MNTSSQKQYIYIVECSDGTLYTGYTNDIPHRIKMHNLGKGAKYTRSRLPVRLVYSEQFDTKSDAMKREYAIKQLSRDEKLGLISTMASNFQIGPQKEHIKAQDNDHDHEENRK